MRLPRRIYKRRAVWHWLADAGAPFWLWSCLDGMRWRRCAVCGWRGVGRWKPSSSHGGGGPSRYYCGRHRNAGGLF
jgi:hypothetical protein